ncbi:MAG TPA: protein kinase [Terriglobales bacterium]|nr:protein kinase [Terriglobales bacterium]
MTLRSGTQLGPYEIQSPLGAGGMGEVYRARDTRLNRTVAIKILASHLSSSPELKQRFEREARALSSLNHPNICHLYDIGSQDGTDYLVMEFLEGETLAERVRKGALPLNEITKIGAEVADALQVAHQAGIVHRDLKPGNIMLTRSAAKLMDFGLAKPTAPGTSGSAFAPLPPGVTVDATSAGSPLTSLGTVLGTIEYMSPEQIAGKEADARSDIFALGAVLYEAATGRRAFCGKTQISVASAILEKEPEPISAVKPLTPLLLEQVVQGCLAKSPDDRFQTAHDVKLQLKWMGENANQIAAAAAPSGRVRRDGVLWSAIGALLLLLIAAGAMGWWRPRSPRPVLRATLLPPTGTQFALLNRNGPPAFSPDGKRIAFIASRGGKTSLWVRSLDKTDAVELPGTSGAFFPFWSPDSNFIGFFANGKLLKMDANGGPPVPICNAANGRGATWGAGDVILFSPQIGSAIFQVPAAGGKPAAATAMPTTGESRRWPVFLPDGKHFIYLRTPLGSVDENNEIRLAALDNSEESVLLHGRFYRSSFADGQLLAVRDGALTAQKLDLSSGKLSGAVTVLAEHVQRDDLVAGAVFAATENGLLVYQYGVEAAAERLIWVDGQGKEVEQVVEEGFLGSVRISPDETKVAYPNGTSENNIWVVDLKTGARTRFSFGGRFVNSPVWSPDGKTLYFSFSESGGPAAIYSRPADGSGPQRRVLAASKRLAAADVSPDGKYLIYEEGDTESSQLKALPLGGDGQPFALVDHLEGMYGGLASARNARIAPSGGWLTYQSNSEVGFPIRANESHQTEVYIAKFPAGGSMYQVSPGGGFMPLWGKDGKHLYYLDPMQTLMVVDVDLGKDQVRLGKPVPLFQTRVRTSIGGGGYDITRDGRFLLVNSTTESATPLTLVANWDAELKK